MNALNVVMLMLNFDLQKTVTFSKIESKQIEMTVKELQKIKSLVFNRANNTQMVILIS